MVEAAPWVCPSDWIRCLLPDSCHLWAHQESRRHFYPHRGKRPFKKKSTSHCHHGRRHPEAPLAQWMMPLCFRASRHLLPLMSKPQGTVGLCQSLQKNGSVGCPLILHLSVRVITEPPQLIRHRSWAGHFHLRNQPSMGLPSDLHSHWDLPASDTWGKAPVQLCTLTCIVQSTEVNTTKMRSGICTSDE